MCGTGADAPCPNPGHGAFVVPRNHPCTRPRARNRAGRPTKHATAGPREPRKEPTINRPNEIARKAERPRAGRSAYSRMPVGARVPDLRNRRRSTGFGILFHDPVAAGDAVLPRPPSARIRQTSGRSDAPASQRPAYRKARARANRVRWVHAPAGSAADARRSRTSLFATGCYEPLLTHLEHRFLRTQAIRRGPVWVRVVRRWSR